MPIDASKIKWDTPDQPNPKGIVWDKTPRVTVSTSREEPVPDWGRRNPNLYGMYGALKAIWDQAGKPLVPLGTMAAGTITGTPLGPAGMVAGAALGYGIGKQAISLTSGENVPLKERAIQAAKDVKSGAEMEMGGQIAGELLPPAIGAIGSGVEQLWGRLTGTGKGMIEEAVKSGEKTGLNWNPLKVSTDFDKALRGKISGEEIVENARDALSSLKNDRSAAYTARLREISKNKTWINAQPIKDELKDLMDRYNIKIGEDGTIDTSRIAMGVRGRRDITKVIQTILDWGKKEGDYTPLGLDVLKRQLDDFYSDSSQAKQFVTAMKKKVADTITEAVPEYGEMTKGYAEASKLIKDIEAGLMMRKQGISGRIVADQTLRRIESAMRDNFELRRDLLKVLGNRAGSDLMAQAAGHAARSVVPLGLAGIGPTVFGEYMLMRYVNPNLWPILAASSPRASAEFLRVFGKFLAESRGTSRLVGMGAAYLSGKRGKEPAILDVSQHAD